MMYERRGRGVVRDPIHGYQPCQPSIGLRCTVVWYGCCGAVVLFVMVWCSSKKIFVMFSF